MVWNSTTRKVVPLNKFLNLLPYTFLIFLNAPKNAQLSRKNAQLNTQKCTIDEGKMHNQEAKNAQLDIDRIEHFPLLTTNSHHYPLGLSERIVYSYLAFPCQG